MSQLSHGHFIYIACVMDIRRSVVFNCMLLLASYYKATKCSTTAEVKGTQVQNNTSDDESYRIVGGTIASRGQFPFIVAVHTRLVNSPLTAYCGGTLITPEWVLTAAHCLYRGDSRYEVQLGVTDKREQSDILRMVSNYAIVHPYFMSVAFGSGHDIGLVRLPTPAYIIDGLQSVRLPMRSEARETFANYKATVVGWGQDGSGYPANENLLKHTAVRIADNRECSPPWFLNRALLCTDGGTGRGSCQGDSGSPLLVEDSDGYHVIVGIVSFGDGVCPSNLPSVYTRITPYLEWIHSITDNSLFTNVATMPSNYNV